MKLTVTPRATQWFQEDWGFKAGDSVRIFIRYGGGGTSFSLGLRREKPAVIGISTVQSEITFFIDEDDVWYLDNRSLTIDYDVTNDDIVYGFTEDQNVCILPSLAD